MILRIGEKTYEIPEDNLTAKDYDRIREFNDYATEKQAEIRAKFEADKKTNYIDAYTEYALNNQVIMETKRNLVELIMRVQNKELDTTVENAQIKNPTRNTDKQYNSLLKNFKQAYSEIMGQVNEKAMEFHKKAQEASNKLNNDVQERNSKKTETPIIEENQTPKTYTEDEILREYEGKTINVEYTNEDVEKIINEVEQQQRNRNVLIKISQAMSDEFKENVSAIENEYKDKKIDKPKGIFAKIRNFFTQRISKSKLEKSIEEANIKKLDKINSSIEKAFKPQNVSTNYKESMKRTAAIAAALLMGTTMTATVLAETEAHSINETPKKNELTIETDAISQVSNVTGVNAKGNMIEFSNVEVDGQKLNIAIDKNNIKYSEIQKILKDNNINVSKKQVKDVINEFMRIDAKNISNDQKAKLLKEYLENSDDGMTAKEKASIIKAYFNQDISNNKEEEKQIQEEKSKTADDEKSKETIPQIDTDNFVTSVNNIVEIGLENLADIKENQPKEEKDLPKEETDSTKEENSDTLAWYDIIEQENAKRDEAIEKLNSDMEKQEIQKTERQEREEKKRQEKEREEKKRQEKQERERKRQEREEKEAKEREEKEKQEKEKREIERRETQKKVTEGIINADQLITSIFTQVPESSLNDTIELNLKNIIDTDYIRTVMYDKNMNRYEKESKLKDKVLEHYREELLEPEVKKEYDMINNIMNQPSIPNDETRAETLSYNLKYVDKDQIDAIVKTDLLSKEEKIKTLKQMVDYNYEVSQLTGDAKKAYELIDAIYKSPEKGKHETLALNLKPYGLDHAVYEIFNKYYLPMYNSGMESEKIYKTTDAIIVAELRQEVLKMEDRQENQDLYDAISRAVRSSEPESATEGILDSYLKRIDDMNEAINNRTINVQDLANRIKHSDQLQKYEVINEIFDELVDVRNESKLNEEEQELNDFIKNSIESNMNTDKFMDELNKLYPIDDMENIGILEDNSIEAIMNNKDLSNEEKTKKIRKLITDSQEEYEKLGFEVNHDKDLGEER